MIGDIQAEPLLPFVNLAAYRRFIMDRDNLAITTYGLIHRIDSRTVDTFGLVDEGEDDVEDDED